MPLPHATNISLISSSTMLIETVRITVSALTSNHMDSNLTKEVNETEIQYIPYRERPETYFVPIIFCLIMLIGLTGNSVLLLMMFRHRRMRNAPNTYVLSLAIGDILVLVICVPYIGSIYIFESWHLGLSACKIGEYANDLANGISVFTLTALSVDRYFAIVDPWNSRAKGHARQSKSFAVVIVGLIWLLAIVFATPATLSHVRFFRVNGNVSFYVCYPFPDEFGPSYPKVIVLCRFFIYYVIPLTVIGIFYVLMALHLIRSTYALGEMQVQMRQVQARMRLVRMALTFIVTFAICFLPKYIFMIWFHFNPTAQFDYNNFWHYFRILGFCLAFFNSCVNPFALYYASNTFKKYFNRYLFRWRMHRMQQQYSQSSDQSSRGQCRSLSRVNSKRGRNIKLSTDQDAKTILTLLAHKL